MKITYYIEILSSWCTWAEPTWAELKKRYAGRADVLPDRRRDDVPGGGAEDVVASHPEGAVGLLVSGLDVGHGAAAVHDQRSEAVLGVARGLAQLRQPLAERPPCGRRVCAVDDRHLLARRCNAVCRP